MLLTKNKTKQTIIKQKTMFKTVGDEIKIDLQPKIKIKKTKIRLPV